MKKVVALFLVILLTCGLVAVSAAESTNPNKALAALTANYIKEIWPDIDYSFPGEYTKGGVQSNIVKGLNQVKHEEGYEKEPYEDWVVRRIVLIVGLGWEDEDYDEP